MSKNFFLILAGILIALGAFTYMRDHQENDRLVQKANEAISMVSTEGEALKTKAGETVASLKEKTGAMTQQVRDKAADSLHQAGEKAKETIQHTVKDTVDAAAKKAGVQVSDATNKAVEQAKLAAENAKISLQQKAGQVKTIGQIASGNIQSALSKTRQQASKVLNNPETPAGSAPAAASDPSSSGSFSGPSLNSSNTSGSAVNPAHQATPLTVSQKVAALDLSVAPNLGEQWVQVKAKNEQTGHWIFKNKKNGKRYRVVSVVKNNTKTTTIYAMANHHVVRQFSTQVQ